MKMSDDFSAFSNQDKEPLGRISNCLELNLGGKYQRLQKTSEVPLKGVIEKGTPLRLQTENIEKEFKARSRNCEPRKLSQIFVLAPFKKICK